jgi:nickel-dependent lactate racemase
VLTYSGNARSSPPSSPGSTFYYPPPSFGIAREIPDALQRAVEHPLGMEPLSELVKLGSKVTIAFDDNCQPFPPMRRPDIRQVMIERLLELLYSYGVRRRDITLRCAIALHRKMQVHELEHMLDHASWRSIRTSSNFDAEDRPTSSTWAPRRGEPVQTSRAIVDSDLVIYVDTIQIPLNGGHKSVAVGFGTYDSIAPHHNPEMTRESPHVMQPEGSCMHDSITRISRQLQRHCRIMVIEAAMNGATYPAHLRHLAKPPERARRISRSSARRRRPR